MRKPRDAAAWTLAASLLLAMTRGSTGVLQGALDSGIVSFGR